MLRPAPALLLALLLAGCTAPAPQALAVVEATLTVRFSSSLDAPLRLDLATADGLGEMLDERSVQVPSFGSAAAVVAAGGVSPWRVEARFPNGTLVEQAVDVAAGQHGITLFLFPDRVGAAAG